MKKFSEMPFTTQLGIMLALAAGLVLAGEFLYLNDMRTSNTEKESTLQRLKEENERVRPIEARFKQIKIENEQLDQQLANLRTIVPDDKYADDFIRMVQDAGQQSGITIRRFTSRPVTQRAAAGAEASFIQEMPFELALDGNFFNVLQFFDRMSKLNRIANVSNLAMGPAALGVRGARKYSTTGTDSVLASCTATTFFSREEQPAAVKK